MKKNTTSSVDFSTLVKARPLTLEQVLRLRDGLNIPRSDIPGVPAQIVLPNYNRKKGTLRNFYPERVRWAGEKHWPHPQIADRSCL